MKCTFSRYLEPILIGDEVKSEFYTEFDYRSFVVDRIAIATILPNRPKIYMNGMYPEHYYKVYKRS